MSGITDYNKDSLKEVLSNFDRQIEHAIEIGEGIIPKKQLKNVEKVVLLGMGGSAIGGDLARSFALAYNALGKKMIFVNRGYDLPNWVDENTLVIASSYSGNTEETLNAVNQAKEVTSNIACITSGGELTKIAHENNWDIIFMPGEFQPRCALGYSLITLLSYLIKVDLLEKDASAKMLEDFKTLPDFIRNKKDDFLNDKINYPGNISTNLNGKIPIIYSSEKILGPVNLRWRAQLHENSKVAAFGSFLPEMNHNEINAYSNPKEVQDNFFFIFLEDASDNIRIRDRISAMIDIMELEDRSVRISSPQEKPAHRLFELLYLADWISMHLAEKYNENPIAIPIITKLKRVLSEQCD